MIGRLIVATLLLSVLNCGAGGPSFEIPPVDLNGAETEVAAAILAAQGEIESAPHDAERWALLGARYRQAGWTQEAATCFGVAGRLEPAAFAWPYLRGHTVTRSDPVEAAEAFQFAIRIDDEYWPAHLHLAERWVELNRPERARRSLERALKLDRDNAHALAVLGQLDLARKKFVPARELLERALASDPRNGEARRRLSQVLLALGDEVAARVEAERARPLSFQRRLDDPRAVFAIAPAGSIAWIERGRREYDAGRYAEAAAGFQRALAADPTSSSAHFRLGMSLRQLGRYDEAASEFERFHALEPTSTDYAHAMGELARARGDDEAAEWWWRQVLEATPDSPATHYALGYLFATLGRGPEALEHLESATALDPFDAQYLFAVGVEYDRQGRSGEAERALVAALRLTPRSAELRFYYGTLLARGGDHVAGAQELLRAVELAPERADYRINLGVSLSKQSRFEPAADQFRLSIRLDGGSARGYHGLAGAFAGQGRDADAIAAYLEALRRKPNWRLPAQRAAWLLATSHQSGVTDAMAAVRLAEYARDRSRSPDVELLDTLAAAYARDGRFDVAARIAGEAIAIAEGADQASQIRDRQSLYLKQRAYTANTIAPE